MKPGMGGQRKGQEEIVLRVMTFNIRHGKGLDDRVDLERVGRVICEAKADIVALQEVDRFHPRSGWADQPAVLGAMTGMRWCFSPSLQKGKTEYGNAVLTRYPVLRTESVFLSGKERRSVLRAEVEAEGKRLTVLNTHLAVREEERRGQTEQLAGVLRRVHGPAVLMGDWNMEANHPLFFPFLQDWRKLGGEEPRRTLAGDGEADHILIRSMDVCKVKVWTMPTDASDHVPVVAQFFWMPGSFIF